MTKRSFKSLLISVVVASAISGAASANELVFQGQNAGLFPGANPADTTILMNSVYKPAAESPSIPTQSPASLIEDSVVGQISSNIYNQIFTGTNPSGFFNLGGGSTISYTRSGGNVTITITDPVNGTTTVTVPDV